jgi:hypothetical protein
VLLIFQGVLQTKFLPSTGLDSNQAYHIIMALMVLVFGLAAVGIIAWLIIAVRPADAPLPQHNLYVLAFLLLSVLTSTVVLASGALDRSTGTVALPPVPGPIASPTPTTTPSANSTPTPSPTSSSSPGQKEVTRSFRVCTGEYESACDPHDSYLYCYVDLNAWAKARCDRFKIQKLNERGGNKCGYGLFEVLCTSTL